MLLGVFPDHYVNTKKRTNFQLNQKRFDPSQSKSLNFMILPPQNSPKMNTQGHNYTVCSV